MIVKHVERTSDTSKNGVEKVDKKILFLREKVKALVFVKESSLSMCAALCVS